MRPRTEHALIGRSGECRRLAELVGQARGGEGGALVLTGEPGIGKSELLEHAVRLAGGFRVIRAGGVPSEEDLTYGAVHRLVRPLAEGVPHLPPAARQALERVLGRRTPPPRERLRVAVATLGLLTRAAARRPLLVLLDDLRWIDAESRRVLGFVARRVGAERALVLAATDGDPAALMPGVPVLPLRGLDEGDCLRLIAERCPTPVAPGTREVLAHAADGNPLALLELLRTLSPAQLGQPALLPDPLPLGPRLTAARLDRFRRLPAGCRRLLVLLAAEPRLEPLALVHVTRRAGLDPVALAPAADAGLVTLSATAVRFRRPDLGRVIYQTADLAERHWAHQALARAFAETGDERRTWHEAALAPGADDGLADELERQGTAARRRGEQARAAALLERSAWLGRDGERRARRLLGAADCDLRAGRPRRAARLLDRATPLAGPDLLGRLQYLQGVIALRQAAAPDAFDALLSAAGHLAGHDRPLAVKALVAAGEAGLYAGDAALPVRAGRRLRALLGDAPGPDRAEIGFAADFLLGVAGSFEGRLAEAVPRLRRLLDTADRITDPQLLTWGAYGALFAADDARARALASRAVALARAAGDTAAMAHAMQYQAYPECWLGGPAAATRTAVEGLRLARETGQLNCARTLMGTLMLAAGLTGDARACGRYADRVVDEASEHGLGLASSLGLWGLALLSLAEGDWARAAERLGQVTRPDGGHPGVAVEAVPTYVEAAVRAGRRERAERAAAAFDRWAGQIGRGWPAALAARCRALLDTGDPDRHYREALRLHRSGGRELERARTALLYGEHLNRERRRGEARVQLRDAAEVFRRHRAGPWLERARAELRAGGDGGPDPAATDAVLTSRQRQIARLVAEGATNKEVAARLSLSPRTVDHHLRHVFERLGITSRTDLVRRFATGNDTR
ncbi:AAA family ATPase [Actinomadura namibiensis]|uniref:DNA-binding CsgD family transcriptional regulator n=1 Tax=Actinomadura namibiensis TaxID=182080 RepID=A0A7W3QRH2_ACTNM|nr:LuxR family transcriptional regulator [Actinomadura namibiensis]MBA8956353.1 DNA-binding CsgD family transcriptional regulator [Actinomadura namibiensis]